MKFPFLRKFGLALVCTTLFVGCGDDNSKSNSDPDDEKDQGDVSDVEEDVVFENIKDLPKCSDSLSGAVYRVKDDHYSCFNDEWEKVSLFAKSICNIQECGKKTDGDFAYSKLNATMYKCVADQWLDQDGKGFKESDYVDCYMEALVQKSVKKVSELPDCGKDDAHAISKVKDDYYVCLSKEWTKLADQVVSVGDLPECGKDESTVFVLGKMKAYVCKDGDWSCDGKVIAKVERDTVVVLDTAAANESVKVRGICMPSVSAAEKGEEVSWKFINLGGAPYTYAWTIDGETSAEVEPKGSYTTGGMISASLVLNKGFASESDEIVCSSLEIAAEPVSGCKCEASASNLYVSENEPDSVTWSITGCSGGAPFSQSWSIGGIGETKKIVEYTTASYTPRVTISNADDQSMYVTCPTVSFVGKKSAQCYLTGNQRYWNFEIGSLTNMNDGSYTLVGDDGYFRGVSYLYDGMSFTVKSFDVSSSSSEPVEESSSSSVDEPIEESSSSVEEPVVESSSSSDEPVEESSSSVEEPVIESSSSSDEPVEESSSSSIDEPIEESSSSVEEPLIESSSSSDELVIGSSSTEYEPYDPVEITKAPKALAKMNYSALAMTYAEAEKTLFNYYLLYGADTICSAATVSCAPNKLVAEKGDSVSWSVSSINDYEPVSYQWTFSDGTSSTSAKPVKAYAKAGTVRAKLLLNKGMKNEATIQCNTLNVERSVINGCTCGAPEVVSATNDLAAGPVTYKWTINGCTSSGGETLNYDWNGMKKFGENSATVTVSTRGRITPVVTVFNSDARIDVTCGTVMVNNSTNPLEILNLPGDRTELSEGDYLLESCSGRDPAQIQVDSDVPCEDLFVDGYTRYNDFGYPNRCYGYVYVKSSPVRINVPKKSTMTIRSCFY